VETLHCDVIGCGAQAQWFLVFERDSRLEEQSLCRRHWLQLMADRSSRVIRWRRASSTGVPEPDLPLAMATLPPTESAEDVLTPARIE
jgi:hypothetical protein